MKRLTSIALLVLTIACASTSKNKQAASSTSTSGTKYVKISNDGKLVYYPDEKGNIIPDFSRVGFYAGDKDIPTVAVVKTIEPTGTDRDKDIIQSAIDEVSKRQAGNNGYKGTILLKKGLYRIPSTIEIQSSGIVLRGEGDTENGTKLLYTSSKQSSLILATGSGSMNEDNNKVKITDAYVPVGATSFNVANASAFKIGDKIILYRPGTEQWIKDLKMDQIVERPGTKQWKANEYNLKYERVITNIQGNKIFIDNPVVMALEAKYGGGQIYKYSFNGRINNVGIENIYMESTFESDTAENHGWDAISYEKIENSWVRNVTAKHFGNSCVNLGSTARNISVLNSNCFEHKSIITGGRRYSFNNDGQMNLFADCHATDGRHDYVTGARTNGPNVFVNSDAKRTHADIGPHHRWSSGTLYDNIVTDGEINIQDRGNYGSGHGWVGITQILWNCTAKTATVQSPHIGGNNYSFGLKGQKSPGRFKDRPDGYWEAQNETVQPTSLYYAQLNQRKGKKVN